MTSNPAPSPTGAAAPPDTAPRRAWLAVLARADTAALEAGLQQCAPALRYEFLRRPERGMVMLRGRAGGTGDAFNLGEASVTRCTVRLADGQVGCGHVLGRDTRKAELVAVLDALLQEPAYRATLEPGLLASLRQHQQAQRRAAAAAAGASKVAFFTLVRGQ
ncbi:MAG: phosphonate C-P lyase system protein PhnG [Burkholderiales bacterium]|nr:phosphonate C-P lyase system protein PhnG [Burkholderiales bacterium]